MDVSPRFRERWVEILRLADGPQWEQPGLTDRYWRHVEAANSGRPQSGQHRHLLIGELVLLYNWKWYFIDLTPASHRSPKWSSPDGMKDHFVPSFARRRIRDRRQSWTWSGISWRLLESSSYCCLHRQKLLRTVNLLKASKKEADVRCETASKRTALEDWQTKWNI